MKEIGIQITSTIQTKFDGSENKVITFRGESQHNLSNRMVKLKPGVFDITNDDWVTPFRPSLSDKQFGQIRSIRDLMLKSVDDFNQKITGGPTRELKMELLVSHTKHVNIRLSFSFIVR